MKEKTNCKIIQDLLPNYIENLTSSETNKFIEDHLNKCEECTKILKSMNNKPENEKVEINKKEVDYMKKYNKKMKNLKSVLTLIGTAIFALIYVYTILVLSRWNILTTVSKAQQEYLYANNYYYSIRENGATIKQCWKKDNIIKVYFNLNQGAYFWIDTSTSEAYIIDENQKRYSNIDIELVLPMGSIPQPYIPIASEQTLDRFLYALDFSNTIKSSEINHLDCWIFDYGHAFDTKYCVDKYDKLLVYDSDENTYNYEFNTVTDEDVAKPDLTQYSLDN